MAVAAPQQLAEGMAVTCFGCGACPSSLTVGDVGLWETTGASVFDAAPCRYACQNLVYKSRLWVSLSNRERWAALQRTTSAGAVPAIRKAQLKLLRVRISNA